MGKYVMICPDCAKEGKEVYIEVRGGLFNSGFFGDRRKKCPNGHEIWVQASKMALKVCPYCGNNVVYDQSKGESAVCPTCHKKLNTIEDNAKSIEIKCPQCSCQHTVSISGSSMVCPVCDAEIDIQREISKVKMSKKNVVSLIKYEGDNNTLVWKHPIEDFKLGSQLIVHETQEALLFCGGEALDLFTRADTYTLTTEKIPLLSSVYKLPSGDDTFHSEVYFINKTVQTGIRWGTRPKIRVQDPLTGHYFSLGASGELSLYVSDSKRLILKLIGTTDVLAHSHNLDAASESTGTLGVKDTSSPVLQHIKSVIMTKMRPIFTRTIKEKQEPIFEIDNYIDELSSEIKEEINKQLEEYGLTVPDFFIRTIQTPDQTDENPEERARYEEAKALVSNYSDVKRHKNQAEVELAKADVERIKAEIDNEIRRKKAATDIEIQVAKSKGLAEGLKYRGMAKLDVMKAGGVDLRDKMNLERDIAVAKGIGQMGSNGGGSLAGELVGLAATAGIAGNFAKQAQELTGFSALSVNGSASNGWTCICGNTGITDAFCSKCGGKRPEPVKSDTWDCTCGNTGITDAFCSKCGSRRPEPVKSDTWDCACGNTGITDAFCSKCGSRRPEPVNHDTWDCACGNTGITDVFCGKCGRKRNEQQNS